jgi:acetylglutamate kinase
MMNPLIIKLGGVLLDSEEALERLFTALVNYRESHGVAGDCPRRRLRGG